MPGTPIKVAIVGQGRSGWGIHSQGLRKLPELYQVVAITDADPRRVEEGATALGCRGYASFEELVRDPAAELVVVASPSKLHLPQAVAALQAGKHVVCEKPVGFSAADVDEMIAAARKAGKLLAPFQQNRYAPDFEKVREVVASGVLGRIVHIRVAGHGFKRRWDWQTLKEFGGGSLNNNGPHFLDQMLELFGDAEPEVFCDLQRTLTSGDAEDHVKLVLKAEGSPTVELELTDCVAFPQPKWFVCGTAGGLTGSGSELKWKWVDWSQYQPRPVQREPTPDRSYNNEQYQWQEASWQQEGSRDLTGRFYTDLHAAIRDGKPLVITPESVRRRMAIVDRCHRLCPLEEPAAAAR